MTKTYNDMEDLFTHMEELFDPYENDPRVIFKYLLSGSEFRFRSQRIFFLALIGSRTYDLTFEYDDLEDTETIEKQLHQVIQDIDDSEPLELNPDAQVITDAIETLITHNNNIPYKLIKVRDNVNKTQSFNLLDTKNQGGFKP